MSGIPRTIHQIWFQGEAALPPKYAKNAQRLRGMNPEWAYKLWDDEGMQAACARLGPAVLHRYQTFPYMHQKIDLGRYAVLHAEGGMSVDMDVVSLRPLWNVPGLETQGFIVSRAPLGLLELLFYSLGHLTHLLNNAMVLAEPGSPYLQRLIQDVVTAQTQMPGKMYRIQFTTGPFIFTRSLEASFQALGRRRVTVLPPRFFEPCYSNDPTCVVDSAAILDHQHATTWIGDDFVQVSKLYFTVKPFLPLFFLCVAVVAVWLWGSSDLPVHHRYH